MEAADRGQNFDLVSGLITLLIIITLMDIVVWQPLTAWSEKFRYEFAASPQTAGISFGMTEVFKAIGPGVTRAVRNTMRPVSPRILAIHREPSADSLGRRKFPRLAQISATC